MRNFVKVFTLLALGQNVDAAFGITSTSKGFKVDTDGGLVFEVNKYSATSPLVLHELMELQIQW
jgi:rhamnogalacturonan endolyase